MSHFVQTGRQRGETGKGSEMKEILHVSFVFKIREIPTFELVAYHHAKEQGRRRTEEKFTNALETSCEASLARHSASVTVLAAVLL
jgi:hypothetical protein